MASAPTCHYPEQKVLKPLIPCEAPRNSGFRNLHGGCVRVWGSMVRREGEAGGTAASRIRPCQGPHVRYGRWFSRSALDAPVGPCIVWAGQEKYPEAANIPTMGFGVSGPGG